MRIGNWMQTYPSGSQYWPADPMPDEVNIADIAHHLSMLCRYTGGVPKFYSVAEHSVHVSRLVPREHALAGLLHDAPEYVLNDISRPVKYGEDMSGYRRLEFINWNAIFIYFGLPLHLPPEVHWADNDMLFHERAAFRPGEPFPKGWGMGLTPPVVLRADIIKCWSWQDAKRLFLRRFYELTLEDFS